MQVKFIFVGKKLKLDSFCEVYIKRIKAFCSAEMIYIKPSTLKLEALFIQKKIKPDDFVFILDENGKQLNSYEFANLIETINKTMVFVVGGAFGIDKKSFKNAFFLSLSKLTLPHQIARLIVCESVYRSFTIIKNIPYHKE
ncbi:23S rRNA (pseudouridine(1915)-N(3))-methyltransferase RlmH [Desulfurella sp.]|uniref:23S rRNA (pseudouridine(1915)-N(3))-methyltransferase RlmH n=1 Tax=Desulfurella sp. TaxID=1962857 RepID=UPI003D0F3790